MSEIVANKGWWGIPPHGTSIDNFSGTIVWPKRKIGAPCPEVGDTILDSRAGKSIGFVVNEVGDGDGLPTDDYYIRVTCDGHTYEEES